MKKTPILMASILAMSGSAFGQDRKANPFEDKEFLAASIDENFPQSWEVMWEVFSIPFAEAAKLRREIKDQKKIYADLVQRVEEKKAVLEIFELNKLLLGQKSEVESVEEFIYPTEYEPPELPNIVRKVPGNPEVAKMIQTPATPTAYDTQDVGLTLHIDGSKGLEEGLRLDVNLTKLSLKELEEWGQKKSTVKMPRFERQEIKKGIEFRDGQTLLVGTLSPVADKGKRVWLIFATATSSKK